MGLFSNATSTFKEAYRAAQDSEASGLPASSYTRLDQKEFNDLKSQYSSAGKERQAEILAFLKTADPQLANLLGNEKWKDYGDYVRMRIEADQKVTVSSRDGYEKPTGLAALPESLQNRIRAFRNKHAAVFDLPAGDSKGRYMLTVTRDPEWAALQKELERAGAGSKLGSLLNEAK